MYGAVKLAGFLPLMALTEGLPVVLLITKSFSILPLFLLGI
ncbi:hypothetical protein [Citrobacter freundii]|uniref:Uncharacterized protein n=1 Tax=Citrobacter freundii TaxID=546 RepID=A0A7G2J0T6_CITFR|nr:hypothetical protein [Citrobacter freundii]